MRRRKPRVVWLPPDLENRVGIAPVPATLPNQSAHFITAQTGNAIGASPDVTVIPVVKDVDAGDDFLTSTPTTLSDIANSGYRLRRIVGKINVLCAQGVAADGLDPTLYQVTAGFIILRVRGGSSPLDTFGSYDPSAIGSSMDPWIWRRSWIVCDQEGAATINRNTRAPRSNFENYSGGNSDGPHCDQKTARLVGPEERLFFVQSVQGLDGDPQAPNPGLLLTVGDVRVLASMRTSMGNRRNASR